MLRNIFLTTTVVVSIIFSGISFAEIRPRSMLLSAPKNEKSANPANQKADYVLPFRYLHYRNDRIYEPQQYSCSMKNKVKYCVTHRGKPLNGQIISTYNSLINYEMYQNGYQQGTTSSYSADGTLVSRAYYKKGLKDGAEVQYYPNGNIYLLMKYKDGALNGRVEQYGINGNILGEFTYKDGWFKSGYCKNERKGESMQDRLKESLYNEIIPCGK